MTWQNKYEKVRAGLSKCRCMEAGPAICVEAAQAASVTFWW